MQLEIAVLSKAGGRQVNEDACGCWSGPGASFCILSDGAGGHDGGDVASKIVVRHVLDWFHGSPECSAQSIEEALRSANAALIEEQQRDARLADMRATVVVLAIDSKHAQAIWGHLGDSRLYLFRRGHIVAQTRDHSVVQNMVDAGYLQSHALRSSPHRSQLFGALGNDDDFEPRIEPDKSDLQGGDVFLLCSDGLWEYVDEDALGRTLNSSASGAEWLHALETQVLANGHKGQDNYSAIAIFCRDAEESSPN
jgi:serine/threonine protein phosphatase PrpC